jgi:anthranilate phosphoribosyltransferase
VVHGADRLDELSTTGPNQVSYFGCAPADDRVVTETLDPRELGFAHAQVQDLRGGEPKENAQITRAVLSGEDRGPRRNIVLLNAAAALLVGGVASDLQEGVARAAESIDSGAALGKLDGLITFSQAAAPPSEA